MARRAGVRAAARHAGDYRNAVETHLRPRWGNRRLTPRRRRRSAGSSASCARRAWPSRRSAAILRGRNRIFRFAARRCRWHGENPFALLENGERPKVSETPERRIYEGDELAQTLAASTEPWTHAVPPGRRRRRPRVRVARPLVDGPGPDRFDAATITFTHQVGPQRRARAAQDRGEQGHAAAPALDRADAAGAQGAQLAHRAAVLRLRLGTGRPLGQRNVLRALYRAQERARDAGRAADVPGAVRARRARPPGRGRRRAAFVLRRIAAQGTSAAAGLPRAAAHGGDGLRRRGGGARPSAPQELATSPARSTARTSGQTPRGATGEDGSADGSGGGQQAAADGGRHHSCRCWRRLPRRRHTAAGGRRTPALAMQKVEGSSPFSRSLRRPAFAGLLCFWGRRGGDPRRRSSPLGPLSVRFQPRAS